MSTPPNYTLVDFKLLSLFGAVTLSLIQLYVDSTAWPAFPLFPFSIEGYVEYIYFSQAGYFPRTQTSHLFFVP